LPAAAVQRGLRLLGTGTLQWRRLPIGGPEADPVWVELAIVGPAGVVRLCAGDGPPSAAGSGGVYVREEVQDRLPGADRVTTIWRWRDGSIDTRVRLCFTAPTVLDQEAYAVGEACTSWTGAAAEHGDVLCRLGAAFAGRCGVMPEAGGGGTVARDVRRHLASLLPQLAELPGRRGAGDYGRSGGVVTNLEYDTTLGLLRCAFASGDSAWLHKAQRSAWHLFDRDLEPRLGLPFPHGLEHRTGTPEPGHAWLRGALWVGLLTADDALLGAVQALGRAIAATPPLGVGGHERLRDYACPLRELEALLVVADDRSVARAADRFAASIARRFDPVRRTWGFGEGDLGQGLWLERGWLTAGALLPALRAHLQRRPEAGLAAQVEAATAALLERVGRGGPGLPTHWRQRGDTSFAEHREQQTAAAASVLDAFAVPDLRRLLRRAGVRAAVVGLPSPEHPDLATEFSLLARCDWVWR
jgi:hypothetical protein